MLSRQEPQGNHHNEDDEVHATEPSTVITQDESSSYVRVYVLPHHHSLPNETYTEQDSRQIR